MTNHNRILPVLMIALTIPISSILLDSAAKGPMAAAMSMTSSPVSWNPRVACTPLVVRITDITANQTASASFAASKFAPGITTTVSGGSAKRWLPPGRTPPGWASPGPACTVTNSKGTTSLFVEIDGVERGSITVEDSATSYDPTNGGTAHSTTYDNTFNVFDPSIVSNYDNSCNSPTDPTCYGRIHLEVDHDWLAAGYCGTGTFCDPSALSSQTNRTSTKIDFQGFVYWDPGNLDGAYHQYNGWELHPLTAWKLTSSPPPVSSMTVSFTSSPLVPQVGQSVGFNANVSGGTAPYTFNWSFGDGITASGGTVSHMYLSPNQFTVSLTARDAGGFIASAQKSVAVGSWNSAVACSPAQTSLEQVLGNVSTQRLAGDPNSTGADYSGGGFRLDGNLSYGSNPTIWPYFKRDLQPPCSVNGTSAFIELHNLTVVDRAVDDCSTVYSTDNGGGSYPNGWQSCDTTFSLVTPGFGDSFTCPQCYMHRIYSGVDRDWNASGVAPLPAPAEGQRIDVQGFVYWNNVFVNASWHSYSGWEIHPITAWRLTRPSLAASLSFSPSNPTPGQSMIFNATASGGTGPYAFTLDFGDGTTATGNQVSHSYGSGTFTVNLAAIDSVGTIGVASQTVLVKPIQGFTLSASQSSLRLPPGKTNATTIVLTSLGGFSGNVSLSTITGTPGPSASLSPTRVALAPNGSGSSSFTVSATSTTQAGTYNLTVSGISGPLRRTVQVLVTVPGFALSAIPNSLFSQGGASKNSTISIASIGGFQGTVKLSTPGAPGGVHLNLNPTNVILSPGGIARSLLTVTADTNVAGANYTITIQGSGGGTTQKTILTLTITTHLTISTSPTSLAMLPGSSSTDNITVTSIDGLQGTVQLSTPGVPGGIHLTLNPTSVILSPGGSASSTLTVTLDNNLAAGNYTITVQASGSGNTQKTTLTLTVISGFTISANPAALTIVSGTSKTSQISIRSFGFKGTVTLSASVSPSGLTATISPATLSFKPGESHSSTLTVASATAGTYTVTINAASGSITNSVQISVSVSDFNISASPASLSLTAGSSSQTTLTLTSLDGFAGTVNLADTVNPTGLQANLSPTSTTLTAGGTGSAVLAISSTSTTPPGTYTITVRGTSGNLAHTLVIVVTVTTP